MTVDEFNNLAFADDLSIIAEIRRLGNPSGGAQTLLNAIEALPDWSGMEVKIVKSEEHATSRKSSPRNMPLLAARNCHNGRKDEVQS